jgi:hypothetical protein
MGADHVANRALMLDALRQELVGPSPAGKPLDTREPILFATKAESYGPFVDAQTGEEVIVRDTPTRRYGVGVLYPEEQAGNGAEQPIDEAVGIPADPVSDVLSPEVVDELSEIAERGDGRADAEDNDEYVSFGGANAFRPSSMAISMLVRSDACDSVRVHATGGRYRSVPAQCEGQLREFWVRENVSLLVEADLVAVGAATAARVPVRIVTNEKLEGLQIQVEAYVRPSPGSTDRLLTVCLVNRTKPSATFDASCLFQAAFEVEAAGHDDGPGAILPYPAPPISRLDEEEQGLELLYHRSKTYAVGHGCSADWSDADHAGGTTRVRTVSLPMRETPSMTPNIRDAEGKEIAVPMHELCGDTGIALEALGRVHGAYKYWIAEQAERIGGLALEYQPAARRHIASCEECANRMQKGMEFLRRDTNAGHAFALANRAILYQQLNAGREARRVEFDVSGQKHFATSFVVPDVASERARRPTWRAFQIAFLLMSVAPAVDEGDPDRDTVDLIWFPTGGGKTEAYLGLAAFTAFYRRLTKSSDGGVQILMRYTLRLLTAQQFQRAARLICAMEILRREEAKRFGPAEFSIGIWLGGDTTPNRRDAAIQMLRKLRTDKQFAENGFLLDRCPWCRAEIGLLKKPTKHVKVVGYEQRGNTVAFTCSDDGCEFADGLPVYVIDDDIYERKPTLLIGTVDKFAALAWKPEARAIFGLGPTGDRVSSPPGLIIQDELHLIAGPLGSVVGLFETLIEELCTDYRQATPRKPKIVCSTATIRRYRDQVLALYGRASVQLFPPPGLDAGDSFFAQHACAPDGTLERGRVYVGVHAPGLGSIQTAQVRAFAAMLMAALPLDKEARDPWWTLLLFFNSLRELGGTVSLLQSDIPDYIRTIRNRTGGSELRYLNRVLELTSRLTREEIPKALSDLETTTEVDGYPVDVCLASSIIEVGVDIDRLSLMSIVGQPKTTSQYIQVSGRVGRQWKERPGIVVTIYGATKARDRSHFERFRTYHDRLYAEVEPTSVTPFSRPVLERSLHAVMAAFVRQTGGKKTAEFPSPYPSWMLSQLEAVILKRAALVDSDEIASIKSIFRRRSSEWERWQPRIWSGRPDGSEIPLLRPAGSYVPPDWEERSWPTQQSMRNVDAECQADITQLYT